MGLRITIVINKQICELLHNHCFPAVIDRNILNVITLHVHCIYAGLKYRNIVLYCAEAGSTLQYLCVGNLVLPGDVKNSY